MIHTDIVCPEGGGRLINFLSAFSKEFGHGVHLGEDFLLACTNSVFTPTDMTPMIRVALVATNLTCEKIVDGIGRLLLKSDVEKLKAKKLQPKVLEAEELLLGRWKDLERDTKLNDTQKFKIFGKACLRTSLFLVGKQKQGREQREFASLDEIRLQCIKDMTTISTPAAHSVEAHEENSASSIVQLHEAKNAMYVAGQKLEIKVGNHYTHKNFDDRVWKCFEVGANHMGIMYQDMLSGVVSRIQVKDIEIAESLRTTKHKPPTMLDAKHVPALLCHIVAEEENDKCSIFKLVIDFNKSLGKSPLELLYQEYPSRLAFSNKGFQEKQLLLVPGVDKVSQISVKESKGSVEVRLGEKVYYLLPPKQYKFDEKSMAYTGMVSPFWLLFNSKPSNELGNMVLSFTTYKNLKIQAIYNRYEVFTHDQLCMMEPEDEETISKEAGKEEKKRKASSTASEAKAAKKAR